MGGINHCARAQWVAEDQECVTMCMGAFPGKIPKMPKISLVGLGTKAPITLATSSVGRGAPPQPKPKMPYPKRGMNPSTLIGIHHENAPQNQAKKFAVGSTTQPTGVGHTRYMCGCTPWALSGRHCTWHCSFCRMMQK